MNTPLADSAAGESRNAETRHVPVLIIGAGPTGLTCATLLAQRGVRSLVVERHPQVYALPRAVHLDDEVLRILQQIGIADRFTAISRPAPGMRLLDGDMRPIAEFRRDRAIGHHGWPEVNLFDQPDLEHLLRDNLTRHPAAELLGGMEAEHIDPGGPATPARVRIRDLSTERVLTVHAQVVLGCDGAGSLVRRTIGAHLRDLRFEEQWLIVDVRSDREFPVWDGVDQVCDPHRAATFMRVGTDRYRWEFRMRPGETAADLTSSQTLGRLLSPWTGSIPAGELHVIRDAVYTFKARVADRWRQGRLFLLGDAAHLTPPFIGQGMGAGLRDAANLAWKLAAADADPTAHDRFLDTYEQERQAHVTHMIRMAVAVGWAMTGGQDRTAAARRMILSRLVRLPGANTAAVRTLSPRLRPGPLVVRPKGPLRKPRLAGTLMPQPILTIDGTGHRLDEIIGAGFTVVTRGPVPSNLTRPAAVLDAVIVRIDGHHTHIELPDGQRLTARNGTLSAWLKRAGASAAVIRPDRVVLAAQPHSGGPGNVPLPAWLRLIPDRWNHKSLV